MSRLGEISLALGIALVTVAAYFMEQPGGIHVGSASCAFVIGLAFMAAPVVTDAKKKPKKKYTPPKLTVYGTVREMTRGTGLSGNPDGGSLNMRKTG
jgi:hypothetical protein